MHHLERALPRGVRQEQPQHGVLFEPAHGVDVALHGRHRAQDRDPGARFGGAVAPVHDQHRERRAEPIGALPLPDQRVPEEPLAEDGVTRRAGAAAETAARRPGGLTPAGRSR